MELYQYEEQCSPVPDMGDPGLLKRWLSLFENISSMTVTGRSLAPLRRGWNEGSPKLCLDDDECYNVPSTYYDEFEELLWLGRNATHDSHETLYSRGRIVNICAATNAVLNTFEASNYPGVPTLANRGRSFYGASRAVQQGLCVALPLIFEKDPSESYVTEHVMELQTIGQFGYSMLSGKLPSGNAAPGGTYDWSQVFGPTGYFTQTWEQLKISAPDGLTGTSPANAVANALGSTGDINNLQILDAATNSLKAAVSSLFPVFER